MKDSWKRTILIARRPLIVAFHCVLVVTAYLTAFFIRGEFSIPASWWEPIWLSLPLLLLIRLLTFRQYGLLEGWWAHTGLSDVVNIARAVIVGTVFFVTPTVLLMGVGAVPRSVVVIDAVLLFGLLTGSRYLSRTFWQMRQTGPREKADRAVIVGDLPSAEPIVREFLHNPGLGIDPVGIAVTHGEAGHVRVHDVPVLGTEEHLSEILAQTDADILLLALPTRGGATIRRVLSRCGHTDVRFKIVPPLRDVIDRRLHVEDVRDVGVDDILGREEIPPQVEGFRETLENRRILITGAGGSIGSELAHQAASYGPEALVLLDWDERLLAPLARTMRETSPATHIVPLLRDVRNRRHMKEVFQEHRPHMVLHAAAYKHVPMMELNPLEAVKNNVLATRDLLDVASSHEVDRLVLISTDKAVQPINIMGQTKRVAERLLEGTSGEGECAKIAVRFGNVLGSEGSVVPILLKQIREGGPVTVTHPEATRYFMTIQEAAHLVLQAAVLGRGGEIFVLDMGEPIRILDLAISLIRLAGLQPGRDVEIRFTGLRPGERLHEEALIDLEAQPTVHPKIWIHRSPVQPGPVTTGLQQLEGFLRRDQRDEVLRWLRRTSGGEMGLVGEKP